MNLSHASKSLQFRIFSHFPALGDRWGPNATIPKAVKKIVAYSVRRLACSFGMDRHFLHAHVHTSGAHTMDPTIKRLLEATMSRSTGVMLVSDTRSSTFDPGGCSGYTEDSGAPSRTLLRDMLLRNCASRNSVNLVAAVVRLYGTSFPCSQQSVDGWRRHEIGGLKFSLRSLWTRLTYRNSIDSPVSGYLEGLRIL